MNKLYRILIVFIIVFIMGGCMSVDVYLNTGYGVKPHVRKEMVRAEKSIRKKNRKIDKYHKVQKRKLNKIQQQPKK